MYKIEKYLKIEDIEPTKNQKEYYESYLNDNNRSSLENFIDKIIQQELLYEELANKRELYKFNSNVDSDNLKNVLLNLYKNQLSNPKSSKKRYYDEIVKLAKNGKCPYCSINPVFSGNATLDHFLPKTKFPELAVSFINLVPCCSDCNNHKKEFSPENNIQQFIQPYFDDISSKRWLYVEFDSNYSQLSYIIKNENGLNDILIERIKFQFTKLKIYEKYQIQAVDELREKLNIIEYGHSDINSLIETFKDCYNGINILNSWKKALFGRLKDFNIEECKKLIANFK